MLSRLSACARSALLAATLLFAVTASAQMHTPPPGSRERVAILDSVRAPLAPLFVAPVRLKVDVLNVDGGWAFVLAQAQDRDGAAAQYRDSAYVEAVVAGGMSHAVATLLRLEVQGWQIVAQSVGITDVSWEAWPIEHAAPQRIFALP